MQAATKVFFLRRYLRIYPAWLIVACLFYISRFHGGDLMAWIDLIGDITINWDFWLHDELNFSVYPDEKERVEQIVLEEMQGAYTLKVPLTVDAGWGKNWLEAH